MAVVVPRGDGVVLTRRMLMVAHLICCFLLMLVVPHHDAFLMFSSPRPPDHYHWALSSAASNTGSGSRSPSSSTSVQTMDYTTLLLQARELQQTLVPARLENVIQTDEFTILIQLRSFKDLHWLLVCWQPEAARVSTLSAKQASGVGKKGVAYSLPGQIKGALQLKTLIRVGLPLPGERIMVLEFADRVTDTEPVFKLYVEVMGRRSNVILVDSDNVVTTCGYQVSPSKSVRSVSMGQLYSLPPPLLTPMPSLTQTDLPDFLRRVTLIPTYDLKKALLSAYRGLSPHLVEAMAHTLGLTATETISELIDSPQLTALYEGPFTIWLRSLEGEAFPGAISRDMRAYTPILFSDLSDSNSSSSGSNSGSRVVWDKVDSILDLVERYYTWALMRRDLVALRQRCVQKVQAALKRLYSLRKDFEGQITRAQPEQLDKVQLQADMLTAYAYSWKPGDTQVVGPDFQTGENVTLTLRDGRSPVEEAQELYKRVRKLKRSIGAVQPLLDQLQLKIGYVEEVETSLQQLSGQGGALVTELQALREIADEVLADDKTTAKDTTFFTSIMNRLVDPGGQAPSPPLPATKGGSSSKSKKSPTKKGGKGASKGSGDGGGSSKAQATKMTVSSYRRSSSSPPVLVGRNSKQNDYITFTVAKPHELWFHARGVPGAHCLLRVDPGAEVLDEDLQFAADVAAYFSKARASREVPIQYTSPKNLKKITGGGPGMVQVMKEKVIWGRPEEGEKLILNTGESNP